MPLKATSESQKRASRNYKLRNSTDIKAKKIAYYQANRTEILRKKKETDARRKLQIPISI